MATVAFSAVIERPADEIFDLLADIRRNPDWCPGFTGAEKLTAGPIGQDAVFRTTMRGMGAMEIRISRYERPRRIWFTAIAKAADITHNFSLVPESAGTRVDQEIGVRPRGVLRLLGPAITLMLKRDIQSNTAALKAYLEAGAGAQAGAL